MKRQTLIIAEAGVNHDGDLSKALELVDVAAAAGADVVKFQTFSADRLAGKSARKAAYQEAATGSSENQHAMLKRLELSDADHDALVARARQKGIEFLSTPFDLDSLGRLTSHRWVTRLKLGSGELTNAPLLTAAAATGLPIILSTGMGTLAETETALAALAVGYLGLPPSRAAFRDVLFDDVGWSILREKVTVLHCTTQYPTPAHDANLSAMETLRNAFGLQTGYSDHCLGLAVSVAAVALGATVIEKHFTLDKQAPGPDHAASLEPDELSTLVTMIREVEQARGDGIKRPRASERANIPVARKSIVAATPIRKGQIYTTENLTTKRPGDGLSPFAYFDLLGQTAPRDHDPDDMI